MHIYNLTRDRFPGFNRYTSVPGHRFVSLDFNHNGHKSKITTAVAVAVPNNLTALEKSICEAYIYKTIDFFHHFGHDKVVSHGLIHTAYPGVIHTEPFFAKDLRSLEIMLEHAETYAYILASTMGKINGSQIILPHKSRDPGAVTSSGISERELARHVIMPKLMKLYGETKLVDYEVMFGTSVADVNGGGNQVTLTEL